MRAWGWFSVVVLWGLFGGGIAWADGQGLTIYNENFAVVRESVPLDLKAGVNEIRFAEMTAHVEPDSVILRDPAGKRALRILEQNYRADPISQGLLLNLYEGKSIDFVAYHDGKETIVRGKIIRSGYVMHYSGMSRYGQQYARHQRSYHHGGGGQPLIDVDGKLRFGLPGTPLFPALTDETILKPTMHWQLATDEAGKLDAELSYVTGGMSWEADYNLVAPERGDELDIIGWVTLDNQSGKTFRDARIKLIAGDVSKLAPDRPQVELSRSSGLRDLGYVGQPAVREKAFDDYHLYTLAQRTTLRDRQTKQVELIRASGVASTRFYVYDGAKIDRRRFRGWSSESIRTHRDYGVACNKKVWSMREFVNTKENGLGWPLPKGRLRFYRRDDDGQLEFTGENVIDHTPANETARVYTGSAFDLVGERRRTDYELESDRNQLEEAFEIKLRNHKKQAVEVRVVEHLYRWSTWEMVRHATDYKELESQAIEFRVRVEPEKEETITYRVRYTW